MLEEGAADALPPEGDVVITLSAEALAEWEALLARPAREVPGLRALMERPSPFAE